MVFLFALVCCGICPGPGQLGTDRRLRLYRRARCGLRRTALQLVHRLAHHAGDRTHGGLPQLRNPHGAVNAAGRAFFGPSIGEATSVGFSDGWFHPDYVPLQNAAFGTLGRNDIGILVLDEPVDFVEPIWIADPIDDIAEGATVTSIGFGVDESQGNSGIKRASDLTVDNIDSTFIYSNSDTNDGGANVCSGDSGGPQVYWDGEKYVQWAVHSWADQNCRAQSAVRGRHHSDWILDQVEIVHGSTDRCEIWGL